MVTAMPDPGATAALAATRFTDVRWVADVGSTNADLLAAARAGAPEGRVLVADHQSAGRGRHGRTWSAPPGASLLVSVLLRPVVPLDRLHACAMAVAVAASEACSAVCDADVRLKWPNDLVVEAPGGLRKLAGVLAEAHIQGRQLSAAVVGMGLNVNWPDPLPEELAGRATALNHLCGREVDRLELLVTWLRGLERWYGGIARGQADGWARLRDAYRARCTTIGQAVRVELADGDLVGTAVDVSEEGHLVVEGEDGWVRPVAVGDVVHLRPVASEPSG